MAEKIMQGTVSVRYSAEWLNCPAAAIGTDALKIFLNSAWTDNDVQHRLLEAWDTYTGINKPAKMPEERTTGNIWRRLDVSRVGRFSTNMQNVCLAAKLATPLRYLFEQSVMVDEMTGTPLYMLVNADNSAPDGKCCFMLERNAASKDSVGAGEVYGCYRTEYGTITDVELHTSNLHIELHCSGAADKRVFTDDEIQTMFRKLEYKNTGKGGNTATKVRSAMSKYTTEYLGFEYEGQQEIPLTDEYLLYDSIDEVIAAHPQKNFRWLRGRHYEIASPDNFEEILADFYRYEGVIAIDTETTGLKITFRSRMGADDQLVGICLSKEIGTGYYFPLQMTKVPNLCGGDHKYFMERYMRKFLTTRKFVTHNLQFDWKVFYIYGINLNVVFDTMVTFALTEHAKNQGFEIGLKSLAARILGLDMFELDDFVKNGDWGKSGMRFSDLPYELCRQYAPTDADMTLALYNFIQETHLLERYGMGYIAALEVQFAKAAGYSEFYGYPVCMGKLPQLEKDLQMDIDRCYADMVGIVGHDFNPRSQPQVVKILYDELNYPLVENKRSTDKDTLKELSEMTDFDDKPLYPLAAKLLEYRKLNVVVSNFLKRKDDFINPDGIIHPSVSTLGARTGRVSIKDPNYQSYNDTVKKNIVPRQGYVMWDCDFSQIEYRVLASMSKEKFLMDSFADWDMDYHTLQASRMFGVPYAAAVGPLRQQAKRVNFALPYGMEDPSLGKAIFGSKTKENTQKAAKLRELYFEGQDNVRRFFDVVRDNGVKNGYTTTLFGRKRFYPKGSASVGKIRRQAGNAVIQGTAADIYKIAVVRVFQMICSKGWLGKVLFDGFIHDEILGELSSEINPDEFIAAWRDAFEVPVDGFCKLYAGFGIGFSWYMAKKQDLHPMFIQELIESSSGRVWDGDTGRYIDEVIVNGFKQHKIRRVEEYLKTAEKGSTVNPVMSSLLEETVTEWICEERVKDRENIKRIIGGQLHREISDKELDAKKKICGIKTLRDWLAVFCYWRGLDITDIDLKTADEQPANNGGAVQAMGTDNFGDTEMSDKDYRVNSLRAFGFHISPAELRVYVDIGCFTREQAVFFAGNFCEAEGTYSLYLCKFEDIAENEKIMYYATGKYVDEAKTVALQEFIRTVRSVSNPDYII